MKDQKRYLFLGFDRYKDSELIKLLPKDSNLTRISYNQNSSINRGDFDQPFRNDLIENIYKFKTKPSDLFRSFLNTNYYSRYLNRCYLSSSRGRVNFGSLSCQSTLEISNLVLLYCCSKLEKINNINYELLICGYPPHSIVDYAIYYLIRYSEITCYSLHQIYNCEKSFIFKNILDYLDENKSIQKVKIKNRINIENNIKSISKFSDTYKYGYFITPSFINTNSINSPSIEFKFTFLKRTLIQIWIDCKKLYVIFRDKNLLRKNIKRKFMSNPYSLNNLIPRIFSELIGIYSSTPKYLLKDFQFKENEINIYLPLHFQPEASTEVFGGPFIDQLIFIQSIRKLVPKEYNILIKLNPLSKTPRSYKKLKAFWSSIEKLENTYIFKETFSTKKLLQNCNCVATVTGTAGFESNLLGKPTIYGGQSQYTDSPLSIRIQELNSSREFIDWFNKFNYMAPAAKENLMNNYLNKLDEYSVPGHYHWDGKLEKNNHKKLLKSILEELIR